MILVTTPRTLNVMQGQLRLSEGPDDVLVSLLGSCVSACLRDPEQKIGGMNHFLLPGLRATDPRNSRYGAHSMEELINALQRRGADRRQLEVWLFGGADLLRSSTGVGASNARFALDFVRSEGLRLRGSALGGKVGRRLRFHPHSGEYEVSAIQNVPEPEPVSPPREAGRVELF